MSSSSQAGGSPLKPFARGEREEHLLGPTRKVRRFGSALMLFIGIGGPLAVFLGDDMGYRLVCDPDERACDVTTYKAFGESTRTFSFDEITGVGYHGGGYVTDSGGRRSPTGEVVFALHLKSGEQVVATTSTGSAPVEWSNAQNLVTKGEGQRIDVTTRVATSDLLFLAAVLLGGAFFALIFWWRTVVVFDRGAGVVTVEQRRPPLPRKVLAHEETRDLVGATRSGVENKWWVDVELTEGRSDKLGPFSNGNVASEMTALLRREGRKNKSGA